MTKNEFDILYRIYKGEGAKQRELAEALGISLGNVNKNLTALKDRGYVDTHGNITEDGALALAPYKVDNAVIMAAGMSSRFAPLSFEKPKGLLKARGEILIERQIRQLKEAGIDDITLVVGYMKETFFYLADKFGVNIVINEDYYRYNNPSTLMRVKDKLKNTYICSSDDYFERNVFESHVYRAYYAAKYADGKTDEYCMSIDAHDRITKVTIGGADSWYMLGHVYWSREFSEKFMPILEAEFSEEYNRTLLWENLYMKHIKELDMYIMRYGDDAIFEFDSLDELRQFDPHYINNTDSKILKNICSVLGCEEREIHEIVPIKQGMTNLSFRFTLKDKKYIYRHPGVGTDEYINRKSEAFSVKVAKELGLDDTFIYMNEGEGWKISEYVDNARNLDYHNENDIRAAMDMARKLHSYEGRSAFDFDIWEKTEEFVDKVKCRGRNLFEDFSSIYDSMKKVKDHVKGDNAPLCICHCDFYEPNFLIDPAGKMYLIDWEYSGNSDPASDLGTFICCSDYTYEEALEVLRIYYEDENMAESELRHALGCIAMAAYYWFVWAIFQESNGNVVGEYLMIWYRYSKMYAAKTIELYENI